MSLDYDFRKTNIPSENLNQMYNSHWGGEQYSDLKPQYKAMVFVTMAVAIGYIRNEKEAEEMWHRIRFYEKMFSPLMTYSQDVAETVKHTLDGVEREFIMLDGRDAEGNSRTFKCGLFPFPVDDVFEGRLPELEKMDEQEVSYYFESLSEVETIIGKRNFLLDQYTVYRMDYIHRTGDSILTRDIVHECIGMRTNVTTKTRASWLKHLMKQRELFPATDAFAKVSS